MYCHVKWCNFITFHMHNAVKCLCKGVDTKGALGASAPPDFETFIHIQC